MEDIEIVYLLGFSKECNPCDDLYSIADKYAVETINAQGILCWYKLLSASMFEGEEAHANLQNIEWITPRVLLHEAAVSAIAEAFSFYPARFGTLFRTPLSLMESLERWRNTLEEYFALIGDRREWGIKLWADIDSLDDYLLSDVRLPDNGHRKGGAYLRYRKAQQELTARRSVFSKTLLDKSVELAHDSRILCHERVTKLANATDHAKELVLNLAVLATGDDLDHFYQCITQVISELHAETLLSIEHNGPWAAYSFSPSLQ